MGKKYKLISLFLCLSLALLYPLQVFAAYTNSYYYSKQNLKVGLESMKSGTIKVSLRGDYIVNGETFISGTSYALSLSNGKIILNGLENDHVAFKPTYGDNTLLVESGTIRRTYKGVIDFQILVDKIMPVNTVNIEDYVEGVIGYEMSDYYELEALKAQAVAARSFALARARHGSAYNVCDWEDCQVYRGHNSKFVNVPRAVEETKGQVIISSTI